MDAAFHYPPELVQLLIDTVPLLFRGKKDVLLFFKGAGVSAELMNDVSGQVQRDSDSIRKYDIARTIITRINERGDATLRVRREVLKRVTEFEDFSTCWPEARLEAMGLVGQIRQVINVKDSFTRMNLERENERKERMAEKETQSAAMNKKREALSKVRSDLSKLFVMSDVHKRGKAL